MLLYPVKDGPEDGFGIEAVDLLMEVSLLVVDGSVGEGGAADMLHAVLWVPCAVEVIELEAPLLFALQLVDCLL